MQKFKDQVVCFAILSAVVFLYYAHGLYCAIVGDDPNDPDTF